MKCLLSFMMVLATATSAYAQQTVIFEGRLVNSLSGDPIQAATVVLEELKRESVSDAEGKFRFENVAPGSYHLFVRTTGYSSRRTEISVTAAGSASEAMENCVAHPCSSASIAMIASTHIDLVSTWPPPVFLVAAACLAEDVPVL